MRTIRGTPPSLLAPPDGCRFHPRCPAAMDICRRVAPPLNATPDGASGHVTACHLDATAIREGARRSSVLTAVAPR
jgi:oligopeptide/dipeptide ABC transporter ATP-binding protein